MNTIGKLKRVTSVMTVELLIDISTFFIFSTTELHVNSNSIRNLGHKAMDIVHQNGCCSWFTRCNKIYLMVEG